MHGRNLAKWCMSRHRAQLVLLLFSGSEQRLTKNVSTIVLSTYAQLSNCSDGSLCPRTKDDLNSTCCDLQQGQLAGLGRAFINPSLLNSIRSSPYEQQTVSTASTTTTGVSKPTSTVSPSVSTTQPTAAPTVSSTSPYIDTSVSSTGETSPTANPTPTASPTTGKGGLSQDNKMYATLLHRLPVPKVRDHNSTRPVRPY